ncbi:G-protein coupled receptor moody-like isoform X2 [Oratosquilla oratoria]|uniref:G-protein coupled receptor moody-like isoform X2 n=1 Tax=Oratosquilla oratoria TaxID=337810 RepID=UPI003F77433A
MNEFPRGVSSAIAVLFMGYMALGMVGNFLTIVALVRCPRVRNVTAAFIISLCVADFLFCMLVLPWEVSRFLEKEWVWGEGLVCTLFPLFRYWNVAVSLLSIAMITINRYIMIAHFSVYKSVYRKGWIGLMIAGCWVFAFLMLLPTLLGKWGRFGLEPRLQTCTILEVDNKSPKQVLFAIAFCVPAIVIVICYSLIFIVIHRSEKRMRQHSTRGMNGTVDQPHVRSGQHLQHRTQSKADRELRRKRNEWRITKMVLIIFLTFLVTYLPITLVKNFDKRVDHPGLHVLGYVLIYLSCCVNPVIYVIMNRQYRQAYKTVLLCKRPRLRSHNSAPSEPRCRFYTTLRCTSCLMHQLKVKEVELQRQGSSRRPSPSTNEKEASSVSRESPANQRKAAGSCQPEERGTRRIRKVDDLSPKCPGCTRIRANHLHKCEACQGCAKQPEEENKELNNIEDNKLLCEFCAQVHLEELDESMECCPHLFLDHIMNLEPSIMNVETGTLGRDSESPGLMKKIEQELESRSNSLDDGRPQENLAFENES